MALSVGLLSPVPEVKGHIRELDGLRGIAILLVLLHHFWPVSGPLAPYAPIAHLGWIGVDLFFVISGFLIAGILLDTRADPGYFRNFYARRTLRIFPLYYLFLAVVFTVVPLCQPGDYFHTAFLQESGSPLWYLLYQGNLREALTGHEPAYFIAPLWSLSIEEQFYLIFPLLVFRLPARRLLRVLIALILTAPLFRLVMLLLVPGNERIQYLATPARMDVICCGCLLALVLRMIRRPRSDESLNAFSNLLGGSFLSAVALGMLAVLVVTFQLHGLDRTRPFCRVAGYSLVALTFTAVVLWTVRYRQTPATGFLRFSPLRYLGKICYGVYLLQRPAEVMLLKGLHRAHVAVDPGSPWLVLAKCGTAIALAMASWHLFESRLLLLKDRFVSSRHPEAGAAAQAKRHR